MEVNVTLLIAQLVNFGIFFGALYFLFFRRYLKALDERRQIIAERLDGAERERQTQEKLRHEIEARLYAMEKDIDRKMREAHHAAHLERERILSDAEAIAEEIKLDAGVMIAEEREKIMKDLRDEVALLSVDLASKILEKNLEPNAQLDLVQSFFRERRPH